MDEARHRRLDENRELRIEFSRSTKKNEKQNKTKKSSRKEEWFQNLSLVLP